MLFKAKHSQNWVILVLCSTEKKLPFFGRGGPPRVGWKWLSAENLIKVFRSKEDNGKLSDSCDPCSLCRGLCQPSSPGDKVRFVFVITFWDFNRCNFVICRYDNACHFYLNLPQKISITSTKDLLAKKLKKKTWVNAYPLTSSLPVYRLG